MARTAVRKYALAVAFLIAVLGLGAIWSYAKLSNSAGENIKTKQAEFVAQNTPQTGRDSSYTPVKVELGQEITLDELLKDKSVRAPRVPKYLPTNAKLDDVRRAPNGSGVSIHYKIGDNWIDIVERPQPIDPDYKAKANLPLKMAERIRPDGSKEAVPLRTNGVLYKTLPDGTREPVAVDSASAIEINGTWAYYSESPDTGVDSPVTEYGRTPRETTTLGRDFRFLAFWKDGTDYSVGGPNIALDELKKIAESMLQ